MLSLTKFTDADISLFEKWLSTPYVARWYTDPASWLDEVSKRNGEYKWIHHFIAIYRGQKIGFCQYYEYNKGGENWHGNTDTDGAYSIDYLIGEPEYLGHGLGKAIVCTLLDKIKQNTDAKKVIVKPESDNTASCATLLASGFTFDRDNMVYIYCFQR